MNKGKGRVGFSALQQPTRIDALPDQYILQELSERIRPDFADEGRTQSQLGDGRQDIGRRSSGISFKKCSALFGKTRGRKVDQQFAQCRNIITIRLIPAGICPFTDSFPAIFAFLIFLYFMIHAIHSVHFVNISL